MWYYECVRMKPFYKGESMKGNIVARRLKVLHSAGFIRLVAVIQKNPAFRQLSKREILDVVVR